MGARTIGRPSGFLPLPFMNPKQGVPQYMVELDTLQELLPGRHRALDIICDGILNGSPYVYPCEELDDDLLAD